METCWIPWFGCHPELHPMHSVVSQRCNGSPGRGVLSILSWIPVAVVMSKVSKLYSLISFGCQRQKIASCVLQRTCIVYMSICLNIFEGYHNIMLYWIIGGIVRSSFILCVYRNRQQSERPRGLFSSLGCCKWQATHNQHWSCLRKKELGFGSR